MLTLPDSEAAVDVLRRICGGAASLRYIANWRPPMICFSTRVQIRSADGTLMQDAKLGPSLSRDGSVAMVSEERDRRDPDKQYHRYRKKVVKADGWVVKDVDVSLISNRGHSNAGVLKDEAPRPVPGDPVYFKLGVRRAHKWYRRSKTDL